MGGKRTLTRPGQTCVALSPNPRAIMKAIPAIILVIACSACTDDDPVIANLNTITLRVPRGQEFTRIHLSDRTGTGRPSQSPSVSFEICERPVVEMPDGACAVHGKFGTWVLLSAPPAGATFRLLTERPQDGVRPQNVELIPLSGGDAPGIPYGSAQAAEGGALLRVRSKVWGDEPQLSTTGRGWPVADCDRHPAGGIGCRFGFLVNKTPVVAQWSSPSDQKGITQAEVWDVASDIDRRIRGLIVVSASKRP